MRRPHKKLTRRETIGVFAAVGLAAGLPACGGARRIDTGNPYTSKQFRRVKGLEMAYVEVGTGDPIVFMHGNPTSSYLWRNVMPYAEPFGRCIAIDMIGMGDSDKLPDSGPGRYNFTTHSEYLYDLFAQLGIDRNVTLVVHDWGGPLGFNWAFRNQPAVERIIYMETSVRPSAPGTSTPGGRRFTDMFKTERMERQVLEDNFFVETLMFGGLKSALSEEDKAAYRKPYLMPGESRRPTIDWPRQIVVDGEPAWLYEIGKAWSDWMAENEIPKLFLEADPGITLTGANREFCRGWKNQVVVTVPGTHFIQEQSPQVVGDAIGDWLGKQLSARD